MNWVQIAWIMMSAASLTLGVIHLFVWFAHFYFDAGRLWLAYTTSGLRLLALGLNFVTGVNINFREVSSLDQLLL
jgi:hypothetical protein